MLYLCGFWYPCRMLIFTPSGHISTTGAHESAHEIYFSSSSHVRFATLPKLMSFIPFAFWKLAMA